MKVRRGFVDLDHGQIHARFAGEEGGAAPLVMFHTNPTSTRDLMPLMRRLGTDRRIVALDTPGLGDSDPLPMEAPEIGDYAAAALTAIERLGLERFDLYGSHTGANMAVEVALGAPGRARRLVLDGIALYSPEMRADLLAHYAPAMRPALDATHLMWAWHFMRDQHLFWPWFRREAARRRDIGLPDADTLHDQVLDVLKGIRTYHLAYRASFTYAKEARLPLLRLPTLVATAETDIFHPEIDRIAAMIPGSTRISLPSTSDTAYADTAESVFREFLSA